MREIVAFRGRAGSKRSVRVERLFDGHYVLEFWAPVAKSDFAHGAPQSRALAIRHKQRLVTAIKVSKGTARALHAALNGIFK